MSSQRACRNSLAGIAICLMFVADSAAGQLHCNALLELGLKDIRSEFGQDELDYYAYKRHCRKTASGWSMDGSVAFRGLSAVLGLEQKEAESFCKSQEQRKAAASLDFQYFESFSVQALQAWVRCLELAERKVFINPILLPETAIFEIWNDSSRDARVQGVLYDPRALRCEGIGQGGDATSLTGSGALDIKLDQDYKFLVHCRRIPAEEGAARVYPATDVTISVDLSTLALRLPADERLPLDMARDIQQALQLLRGEDETIGERLTRIETCRKEKEVCRCGADTGGDIEGHVIVCVTRCSDGRVTDFRVKKVDVTDNSASCPPNP